MIQIVLLFALGLLLIWKLVGNRRRSHLPPGPPLYPILGNLPQILQDHPFRAYHKLAEKYGELMYVRLGIQDQVVVSSYKAMKDILDKEEVSGRFWTGFLEDRTKGKELGMIFSSLPAQKEIKTYVLRNLRDFGFNKSESMESIEKDELVNVHKRLQMISQNSQGGVTRFDNFFQPSLMSVLWVLMGGEKYQPEDPRLHKLLSINATWFQTGNFGGGMVLAFPMLRLLFKDYFGYNKMNEVNDKIWDFIRNIFNERRARPDYKTLTEPKNFVDRFLKEIDKAQETGISADIYNDDQFITVCYDIFQVGAETTSNTLAFGFLYMILYPQIQKKVQEELDQHLKKKEVFSVADKPKVPYTTAVMLEILRMSNVLPVPGPRKVTSDYKYNGYLIPKDAWLNFNTYSVMRDKKIFGEDVDSFRPERFLGEDGKINDKANYIQMAWGAGRRSCIGDKLAQTSVFLYLTYLLRNFSFEKVKGQEDPTTEPILLSRLMLSPHPYELIVKER